jgi:hypothetical protein
MSKDHYPPIVPTVLFTNDQRHPWRLASIERWSVIYHTPETVRCKKRTGGQITKHQHQVYCLPDDPAYEAVQAMHTTLQAALDALAGLLRELGSYNEKLKAAGGVKAAPNPLTPTVIAVDDPDGFYAPSMIFSRRVPTLRRYTVERHTPLMIKLTESLATISSQKDHFVCPTQADWERIQVLHGTAEEAAKRWESLLGDLGTYKQALDDGRYRKPIVVPQLDMRGPSIEPAAVATQNEEDSMAWEYRNALKGGQVKFAGGRWACDGLKERRGQRVGIHFHREYKGLYERADKERVHPDSAPTVWTTEPDVRSRTKIGTLHFAGAEDAAEEEQGIAPARLIETSKCAETDLDDELLGQLQASGWIWEHAKQTPDGRWHHTVRKLGAAPLGRLRRERLEELIEGTVPAEEQPAGPIERAIRGGDLAVAEQLVAARAVEVPGALPATLQDCARRYIAARERAGVALLEMAAELAQARALAQHGTWYVFLEAIGTSEDQADRLLDIHTQAERSPEFADAVRRNFLNPTTAALLARPSTPPAVVEQLLAQPTPPSKREVEQQIREARRVDPKSRTGAGFESGVDDAATFADARTRFARLGWRLERHGAWYKLSDPGGKSNWVVPELGELRERLEPLEAAQEQQRRDEEAITAARKILADLPKWTDSEQRRLIQEAYAHARELRDPERRRGLFAEIDAAADGDRLTTQMAGALEAEFGIPVVVSTEIGPGEDASAPIITVRTTGGGEWQVEATLLSEDLALHPAPGHGGPTEGCWTVTHRATGLAVAALRTRERAEQAFTELTGLDWEQVNDQQVSPLLRDQIMAILVRYADDRVMFPPAQTSPAKKAAPSAPAPVEAAPEPPPASMVVAESPRAVAQRKAAGLLRHGFRLLNAETIILRLIAMGICDRDQRSQVAEMDRGAIEDLIIGRVFAGAWSGDPQPLLALLKVDALVEQEVAV